MSDGETLDLRRILEDDPWQGLTIELVRAMCVDRESLQLSASWAAKIYRNRLGVTGRRARPAYLIALLGDDPADLLRQLAAALEAGELTISGVNDET